jgi:hypothetical protein
MLSLARIIVYLLEGLSITVAIYLITKRQLRTPELATLALTITATFMILDLFAPGVAIGARQGTGFGLGFAQVGGNATGMPLQYYGNQSSQGSCQNGQCTDNSILEGMDDPVALQYYQQYNPYQANVFPGDQNQGGPMTIQPQVNNTVKQMPVDVTMTQQMPVATQSQSQPPVVTREGFEGNMGAQYAKNPFKTRVRSITEIDHPGASYQNNLGMISNQVASNSDAQNVMYSPLTPDYGYRYQLPRGWDELEQPNLSKATNFFTRQTC